MFSPFHVSNNIQITILFSWNPSPKNIVHRHQHNLYPAAACSRIPGRFSPDYFQENKSEQTIPTTAADENFADFLKN